MAHDSLRGGAATPSVAWGVGRGDVSVDTEMHRGSATQSGPLLVRRRGRIVIPRLARAARNPRTAGGGGPPGALPAVLDLGSLVLGLAFGVSELQ
jgi:hypothetical protein